jgi:hypothetical protein
VEDTHEPAQRCWPVGQGGGPASTVEAPPSSASAGTLDAPLSSKPVVGFEPGAGETPASPLSVRRPGWLSKIELHPTCARTTTLVAIAA